MATTTNDGFHEIQLNGKQLAFLGMAVVVVSVVIFLMGVLVGRGVRTAQAPPAGAPIAATQEGAPDVQSAPPIDDAPPTPDDAPAPADAKNDVVEQLTKGSGVTGLTPPAKKDAPAPPAAQKPPGPTPPVETAKPAQPAAAPAAVPAAAAMATSVPTEPSGTGYTIQVAALAERRDAEAMVSRLINKEYPAYMVLPAAGQPNTFRVRVGKFKDKREADRVAGRLTKEEKFNPWVFR
jgi:cell division septation protein DedD